MPDGPERRDVVLVVDDSPETLSLLTDALELAGATVLVANGGAEALAVAGRLRPDIVLMDAIMPGLDGFETTRRLKASAGVSAVPVIFMTGLSDTEHIVRGLEAGGVDYVTKPIAPDEVIARMRVHLGNARLAQSTQAALDTTGRHLLAADRTGRVLWSTPLAARLLGAAPGDRLPEAVRAWLDAALDAGEGGTSLLLPGSGTGPPLRFSLIGAVRAGEVLLRLATDETSERTAQFKARFALTKREAEVLFWVAQGKSNRDVGAILDLSPRTVNKHLEQVFTKLGVENRASATAVAVRAMEA
jgi:DNA-binding NarL/FixJ family response regulator